MSSTLGQCSKQGRSGSCRNLLVDSQDLKDDQACFWGESLGLELERKTSTASWASFCMLNNLNISSSSDN